jgi:hypothetical protein
MLARGSQETLFETRFVQRDNSYPSDLPLSYMVLKGGEWIEELQPDSRISGVLIRDEYVGALEAMVKWFLTEDAMEVDNIEPAILKNPFINIPPNLVSKNWGLVLLGDPGIGE